MNTSKRIINISMIVVIISALISIVQLNKLSLKNPVFLMNYREIGVEDLEEINSIKTSFDLSFITNIHDKRKITNITFKELPNTKFIVLNSTSDSHSFREIQGRFKVNSVELKCNDFKDINDVEDPIITKANVEFDDGLNLDVDLGKIVFYRERLENNDINQIGGSSSNQGKNSSVYKANDDMKIQKVYSPLLDKIKGVYKFDINSEVFDEEKKSFCEQKVNIKKDSNIIISSEYISNDILKKYTVYDIRPKVFFVNDENLTCSVRYCNMTNRIDNSNIASNNRADEIYKYLKARGEL